MMNIPNVCYTREKIHRNSIFKRKLQLIENDKSVNQLKIEIQIEKKKKLIVYIYTLKNIH